MADQPADERSGSRRYEYALGRALRVHGLPNGTVLLSQLLCRLSEEQLVQIEQAAKAVAELANYYVVEAQTQARRAATRHPDEELD